MFTSSCHSLIRIHIDSSGFGRELTLAALSRGDKVIATTRSRSIGQLAELKEKGADILELDVTDPLERLREVAKEAIGFHGRVDVLVNNAGDSHTACSLRSTLSPRFMPGYGQVGFLEEST